jgi:Ca-activated chloride channel family protein
MNERVHETALRQMTAPSPDPRARAAAKRAALAQFARSRVANQDSAKPERLSGQESRGRFFMNWLVPRGWSGAFASVCVLAVATTLFWPMVSRNLDPLTTMQREVERADDVREEPAAPAAVGPPAGVEAQTPPTITTPVEPGSAPRAEPPRNSAPVPAMGEGTSTPTPSIVDSIEAEDIGMFPDTPLAESLQRLPSPPIEEVEVSGFRRSQQAALEAKREASGAVDAQLDEIVMADVRSARRAKSSNPKLGGRNAPAAPSYQPSEPAKLRVLPPPPPASVADNDKFRSFESNPIKAVAREPVSTFSVDVDTASYAFVRRALVGGALPPQDSVRVEEMMNYFDYEWPLPASRDAPFEPTIVVSDSPWNRGRKLVHVAIKGYEMPREAAPDVNLVLLLDVSGSMNSPDKLPLAVQSMEMLLGSLKPTDTIGIVVYAGAAGLVLEPTPVSERAKIVDALRSLSPGGSTAGTEGIELAYQLAEAHFRKGGVNRILLATDGDFNVGISDTNRLERFVERKREKGVMLSVLGFGRGNYRDELSQALAQNGNGVAAYIDTPGEARKVLVDQSSSTLFTIAKDVKIQVEFNPATVAEYRLVGYETRALNREDFNNDAVDAGDVGAGHTVTAIYEITPAGSGAASVDPLRYGATEEPRAAAKRDEYGFLKMRYKLPGESRSKLIERPIPLATDASTVVRREVAFSTAVAGFAQLLRGGARTGTLTYDDVLRAAQGAEGPDRFGYRAEFVELVRKARDAHR